MPLQLARGAPPHLPPSTVQGRLFVYAWLTRHRLSQLKRMSVVFSLGSASPSPDALCRCMSSLGPALSGSFSLLARGHCHPFSGSDPSLVSHVQCHQESHPYFCSSQPDRSTDTVCSPHKASVPANLSCYTASTLNPTAAQSLGMPRELSVSLAAWSEDLCAAWPCCK